MRDLAGHPADGCGCNAYCTETTHCTVVLSRLADCSAVTESVRAGLRAIGWACTGVAPAEMTAAQWIVQYARVTCYQAGIGLVRILPPQNLTAYRAWRIHVCRVMPVSTDG